MAREQHPASLDSTRTSPIPTSETSARNLYLDLLIKALANTIYGDPATGIYMHPDVTPQNMAAYGDAYREVGLDWPLIAHTMAGLRRLENLRELTQCVVDEGIPGDLIETGAWRGGCCILMRGVLKANGVTDRKVYVADSFSGLPPPDPECEQDRGHDSSENEQLAVSADQVRTNFARYGLLDDQVVFVEGLFQDTLPSLDVSPFALLRLDGDLYESTLVALENLYPRLSPGGFVIVDDYGGMPPCRQAVDDYRNKTEITAPITAVDWTGVWWRKP